MPTIPFVPIQRCEPQRSILILDQMDCGWRPGRERCGGKKIIPAQEHSLTAKEHEANPAPISHLVQLYQQQPNFYWGTDVSNNFLLKIHLRYQNRKIFSWFRQESYCCSYHFELEQHNHLLHAVSAPTYSIVVPSPIRFRLDWHLWNLQISRRETSHPKRIQINFILSKLAMR